VSRLAPATAVEFLLTVTEESPAAARMQWPAWGDPTPGNGLRRQQGSAGDREFDPAAQGYQTAEIFCCFKHSQRETK